MDIGHKGNENSFEQRKIVFEKDNTSGSSQDIRGNEYTSLAGGRQVIFGINPSPLPTRLFFSLLMAVYHLPIRRDQIRPFLTWQPLPDLGDEWSEILYQRSRQMAATVRENYCNCLFCKHKEININRF